MKRFWICMVTLVFASTIFLTSCGEVNRDSELKDHLSSNNDALSETFSEESTSFSLFSDYMKSWAKNNDLELVKRSNSYIVISNSATEDSQSEPSTTLLCTIDPNDIQSYLNLVSTASTALLGPEKHGKLTLAITELRDGRLLGMEKIPSKLLKSDNLIYLQTASEDGILTSGARSAVCSFSATSQSKISRHAQALEINMSMKEYTDPFNFAKNNNYPNPINVIGGLLATEKSSGKLFDIASFSCQSHEGYTPYSAKVVVVVDSNNVESFKKKFDKSYSSIEEKFEKLEADFVYTITEADKPEVVLDDDIANNLISLMYTLNTGICIQDEDSGIVYATSYIESISTKNDTLDLKIRIRARDEMHLQDLLTEYETTAGLCSTEYSSKKTGLVWTSDKKSAFLKYFTEKVPLNEEESSDISIKTYETDIVAKKSPDQNMLIYSFDKENDLNTVYNIVHFADPEYKAN